MTCSECRIDPDLHGRIEAALAEYSTSEPEKMDLVDSALTCRIRPATRRRSRSLIAAAAVVALLVGWLAFRPTEERPAPTPSGTVAEQRASNVRALRGLREELEKHRGEWAVIAGGELVGTGESLGTLLKKAEKVAPGAAHRFVFRVGTEGDVEYETLHDRGPMAGMAFLNAAGLKFWEDPAAGKGVFRYEDGRLRAKVGLADPGSGPPRRIVDFDIVTGFTVPLLLPKDLLFPRFEVPGRAKVKLGAKSFECVRFLVAAGVADRLHHVEALGRVSPTLPEPAPFEWVRIPAGSFNFGEPGRTQEVELDAFEIMKYEATNRQWWDYLKREEKRLRRMDRFLASVPRHWGFKPDKEAFPIVPAGLAGRPVVFIEWKSADDFCRQYLPRLLRVPEAALPTSEQWEMAARGTAGERRYPWGDDALIEVNGTFIPVANLRETGSRAPVDVWTFTRDRSPYGVLGMGGNVSEFVGLVERNRWAIRGGSFDDPAVDAAVHYETLIAPGSEFTYRNVGFRAVRFLDD